MAGDDMPAKLVADAERAFEVEAPADVPHARRGARQRLGTRIDREPAGRTVTGFIDTFVDNGQAGTRTGDGSAQVDAAHVINGADDEPCIAALPAREDGDAFDDRSGEHLPSSPWTRTITGDRAP